MKADGMGFKFPEVNSDKCVECTLCEKKCPIVSPLNCAQNPGPRAYAAQLLNPETLSRSQSGGAFQAIARCVFDRGGVVYGAAFDSDLNVCHQRVDDINSLYKLTMSKYVQSDLGDCFANVITDLKYGRTVLFSGTPCQIGGLKRSIPQKLQARLITVDIICHGVPGPEVYREYLRYLESRFKKKVVKFIFRDKQEFGWRTPRESAVFEDGEKVSLYYYNFLFLEKDLTARAACGDCKFCSLDRTGDLTIADCWGWEKLGRKDFDENSGISLLLVNTAVGETLAGELGNHMKMIEVPLAPLLQRNLQRPTERPALADKVAQDFGKHGFEYIHRKYGYTKRNRVRYRMKRYMRAILKRVKKLF